MILCHPHLLLSYEQNELSTMACAPRPRNAVAGVQAAGRAQPAVALTDGTPVWA